MAWILIDTNTAGRHIMPEDEVQQHQPVNCTCGVHYNDEAGAYVHDAFDGREKFERGERKPS
jgi:hypothetical protein